MGVSTITALSLGAIVRGRLRLETALQRERDFAMQVMTNIGQGLTVSNELGLFEYVNPTYAHMVGYTPDEMIGKPIRMFSPEEDMPILNEARSRRYAGETTTYEARLMHRDGYLVPVMFTGVPRWREGKVVGSFTVITNLEERKNAEQQALELTYEKERVRLLGDFIQNVSHDFRTPLTTINTNLYLLQKIKESEKQQPRFEIIRHQIDRLESLVDSLLTMSRLDSQPLPTLQYTDLNRIIDQIHINFESQLEAQNISVRYQLSKDQLPVMAETDILRRGIAEVVENAIRYSQQGGTITISTMRHDDQACAEIRDTGLGISQDDLLHVFERFYRVDKARSTQTGGFGLGLPIAKKIVELHGGTMEAESELGNGSMFKICLPLHSSPALPFSR
ncbi:MAG: ATP-binding protein [Anaerolineae bacterium]